MRPHFLKLFILATIVSQGILQAQVRNVINISQDWKYTKTDTIFAKDIKFDDKKWETINLPHTWNNLDGQDGGNNYFRGACWYRKLVNIPFEFSKKKIYLKFNSANCKTDVYVNGNLVGTHIGSYAAFIFDISKFIEFGKNNTIAVKVDNSKTILVPPLSADFTFFGGITRKVELLVLNPVSISPVIFGSPGVFITQSIVSKASANIKVSVAVDNNLAEASEIKLKTTIISRDGALIDTKVSQTNIGRNGSKNIDQAFYLSNPHLWNGRKDPYLYKVMVEVFKNNIQTDSVVQPIGLRYYRVDKDSGFYLNGQRYPLHGVAYHEERRDKGRAISDEDRLEDMQILTELGCNFIRLSHYQHDQFIYNYCDENGIVVWTEIPVINNIDTLTHLYSENAKQQLTELIKQNYNHPSIVFWGLFNEIDFKPGPDPTPLIRQLNDLSHRLDSTRLTTAAAMFNNRSEHWVPDLISFNKYFGWYYSNFDQFGPWADTIHMKHPNSKIGLSEYGVGANPIDHEQNPAKPFPGGPFHPEEYQCLFHEKYWQEIEKHPFLYATSVWVAFDFSSDGRNEGKNPGVNDKGLVTQDRKLKKDAYFYYKANWNKDPMVYITSRRFTQRNEANTEIKIYSNCDSVKLMVNKTNLPSKVSNNHIFIWSDAILEKGTNKIEAFGYANGKIMSDSCSWHYMKY